MDFRFNTAKAILEKSLQNLKLQIQDKDKEIEKLETEYNNASEQWLSLQDNINSVELAISKLSEAAPLEEAKEFLKESKKSKAKKSKSEV